MQQYLSGYSVGTHYRLFITLFCIALGLLFAPMQAQLQIPRSVLGCGGNATLNNTHRVNGTLSQTAIGRVNISGGYNHNIGFWYNVQSTFLANRYAALVVVPGSHATPGERVKIPLMLEQSKNLNISSAKTFKAILRFNATLLEPVEKSSYKRSNDTGWVEVQGNVRDSAGILKEIEFIAKLGNSEDTPVIIESFSFTETSLVRIATKDGIFSLDGVCREGGQIRLTKSTKATALTMFPNPVHHQATVEANLTERGITEIYMVDMNGKRITTFYQAEAVPGKISLAVNAADIPSGSYFLLMRTPNELYTQHIIVQK